MCNGVEVGNKIKAGLPLVNNDEIKDSPVKDVFRIGVKMAKEDSNGRKLGSNSRCSCGKGL
jgi:pyrimidine-specific ribonucleoside hydrolase